MPNDYYQLTPANIPLTIYQGVSFYRIWNLRFQASGDSFPFFDDNNAILWSGRCMIRISYDDQAPLLSLTSANGGVLIQKEEDSNSSYYGLLITASQTSQLFPGKAYYDIEFERLYDGWVIRPQQGKITIIAEATK